VGDDHPLQGTYYVIKTYRCNDLEYVGSSVLLLLHATSGGVADLIAETAAISGDAISRRSGP